MALAAIASTHGYSWSEGAVHWQSQGCSAKCQIFVVVFVACWVHGTTPAAGQYRSSISGEVRTDEGRVIPFDVTIRLETVNGAPADQQTTDSKGRFEFANLPKMLYHLTATAAGFIPDQRDVDLRSAGDRVIVNLFLTPAMKTRPVPAGVATLMDLRAPEKARKEYEKGVEALTRRSVQEARIHFEKAVADYPCYTRAQTDLALTLSSARELAPAEAALRKAIECDPGFLDAYAQLGKLLNAQKRFAESEALLEKGLSRSAGAWQFYYQLGAAYYGLGKYPQAEEAYLKVQSLNATPPSELHVKLADAYLKQAAYEKAYGEMQTYLRADPDGRFAAKVKNIMQQMESAGVLRAGKPQATPPVRP